MNTNIPLSETTPEPATPPSVPDIHDRVAEAYYGKLGPQFMRETQDRVHWICNQVKGTHLLDVGCSQGIVSLLLGREGHQVTGLDSSPKAIEEAKAYLSNEPAHVQEKVKFVSTDFLSWDSQNLGVDSIVMSEVLEHLVQPQRFVDAAAKLLPEHGTLVVTVPFGINDFIDHKHTFYLLEPLRLIAKHFDIVEVKALGKWLGIVGTRRNANAPQSIAVTLTEAQVEKLETAFFQIERNLRDDFLATRKKLDDANQKYRTATEQVTLLKNRVAQEEPSRQAAELALAQLQAQFERLQKRVDDERVALQKEIAGLREHGQEHSAAAHEAEKKLSRLEAEHKSTQAQLTDANLKYRAATEKISVLTQRITLEEASRNTAEQTLTRLQEERSAQQLEMARLREQGQTYGAAAHEAEKKLIRMEVDLESVRARLDEANHKYRIATEQIGQFKQRSLQESTSLESAEKATLQLRAQLDQAHARLQDERTTLTQEMNRLAEQGQAHLLVAHDAEKRLVRAEAAEVALRARLDEAQRNYETAIVQVDTLKQQASRENATRQAAEERLAEVRTQFEQTRSQLQEERTSLLQEIDSLRAQGVAQGDAAHAAEVKLARLTAEHDELRSRLDGASLKYRTASEQLSALKHRIGEEHAAREAAEQALSENQVQLNEANLKYRKTTGEEIPKLKEKLEDHYSKVREQQLQAEQLKLELRKNKKALADAQQRVQQLQRQKIEAEQRVIQTRAALSFQLGYLLIQGFKSIRGFVGLPAALWAWRKELLNRRRQKNRQAKALEVLSPAIPKTLPASPRRDLPASPIGALPAASDLATSEKFAPVATQTNSLKKLKVACIMDEFTYGSYQPECTLQQLTPGNWKAELEGFGPELLFIESAWRGKDELWGSKVGHASKELQDIVEWCRTATVPTVFWNKEDPVHFETFLTTAKLFDHVFTTDIDCIHRYKAALGHNRVYLLPFACQPQSNNPIETYERKDAFCFAGAYYVKYPERTRDLTNFVTELPSFRPLEIYDRNYGKNDPNYQFPAEYQPYIVGTLPFDQIDKAYKGYRYAINLNSIKQSQSMFARRVFELLASNTVTVSNFSRGVRLLFGDLVITTDNGSEMVRRLNALANDETHAKKLRLAALRKVMQEHTYVQRLSYVASKALQKTQGDELPYIVVVTQVTNKRELDAVLECYLQQCYEKTTLHIVGNAAVLHSEQATDPRVRLVPHEQVVGKSVRTCFPDADLIAPMLPQDYYGPNYLLDIALATRYSDATVIGKGAVHVLADGTVRLEDAALAYRPTTRMPARSAVVRATEVQAAVLSDWLDTLESLQFETERGLAIDEFNYCRQGAQRSCRDLVCNRVDDLKQLNLGISINDLLSRAEQIAPQEIGHDECPMITGKQLATKFTKSPSKAVKLATEGECWRVESALADGKHEYLYATQEYAPADLGFDKQIKIYFDTTPGLNIQLVIVFLDAQNQKISHVIKQSNRNQETEIPIGTTKLRFGLRFFAGGTAEIKGLLLGHRNLQPSEMLGRGEHLLLTNHYPSYDDLYRNGFVHSRVRAYQERGVKCDVFRLRMDESVSYHEFEDVDVTTGAQEVLHRMLCSGQYKSVLVHFLDPLMWEVLQHHTQTLNIIVWIHGAEIQPWWRRDYNYRNDDERIVAKMQSEKRMDFWRGLLNPTPTNFKLVFVSRYFAEEVMEDLGFRIPEEHYKIIHNPINTEIFGYQEKPIELRKKVLSIRPYASAKYANDLSVKAIQWLSNTAAFSEMEFRMIGDGPLFDEILAPLRNFPNVYIERRFLNQAEIAALHKEYGVFLCPTRMDAQGVSRDEAMSSGLVPVTNNVTAIPEFVDEDCGILADGEDAEGIALGIFALYNSPEKFRNMSNAASERVRRQSAAKTIIEQELNVFSDASLQRIK